MSKFRYVRQFRQLYTKSHVKEIHHMQISLAIFYRLHTLMLTQLHINKLKSELRKKLFLKRLD